LATLIIVAVVIIMAALTIEFKASPVFDLANLKKSHALRRGAMESLLKGSQVRFGMERHPGGGG
jgi:ABC-type enterochelin transport system permease subunit